MKYFSRNSIFPTGIFLNTVLSFFLLFNYLSAQVSTEFKSVSLPEAINRCSEIVKEFMQQYKVPGMSAAAAIDGKLIWSQGFGYADVENGVSATKLTKFRIGSVSKIITSAALGKLYKEGKIDIDTPVQKYLPDFPQKRWTITIRQLASHQSGIRHYEGDEFLNANHYDSVIDGLEIFKNDTLLFEPGTDFSYSSYGWNLLSAVIEKAAEQNFLDYMQQKVFNPLNMTSITADHNDSLIFHRSSFYYLSEEGNLLNAVYVDNSNKWAGGGFISNSEDLVNFGTGMIKNIILTDGTLELFQTPQLPTNGMLTKYGLGWASDTDEFGHKWVGHSGGSMGGRAILIIYPEEKIVIAILTNLGPAPAPVRESQVIANILRSIEP